MALDQGGSPNFTMRGKGVFSFSKELWDPSNRFETSWLLNPWLLGGLRALIVRHLASHKAPSRDHQTNTVRLFFSPIKKGLYVFCVRFVSIIYRCTHPSQSGCRVPRQSFSFFTILTYWAIGCYFIVAAAHTLIYAWKGRSPLSRFPRPLQALHSLFYTTIVVFPLLVTIVYWVALYDGEPWETRFKEWEDISQHGLNSAFALFEIVFPRTSPPLAIHLLWLMAILAMYLGLAYLTVETEGFYVYPFLDYKWTGSRGMVAAYVFGIAMGSIVCFGVAWGLIWARRWLTEKKMGMDGKFAKQPRPTVGDVEMSHRL